jgi:hypothetical protein
MSEDEMQLMLAMAVKIRMLEKEVEMLWDEFPSNIPRLPALHTLN